METRYQNLVEGSESAPYTICHDRDTIMSFKASIITSFVFGVLVLPVASVLMESSMADEVNSAENASEEDESSGEGTPGHGLIHHRIDEQTVTTQSGHSIDLIQFYPSASKNHVCIATMSDEGTVTAMDCVPVSLAR